MVIEDSEGNTEIFDHRAERKTKEMLKVLSTARIRIIGFIRCKLLKGA
jgi:hypothetical protein